MAKITPRSHLLTSISISQNGLKTSSGANTSPSNVLKNCAREGKKNGNAKGRHPHQEKPQKKKVIWTPNLILILKVVPKKNLQKRVQFMLKVKRLQLITVKWNLLVFSQKPEDLRRTFWKSAELQGRHVCYFFGWTCIMMYRNSCPPRLVSDIQLVFAKCLNLEPAEHMKFLKW